MPSLPGYSTPAAPFSVVQGAPARLGPADMADTSGAVGFHDLLANTDDPRSIVTLLQQVAVSASRTPEFRQAAEHLLRMANQPLGQNDLAGLARFFTGFVKNAVTYVPDPDGTEYVKTPALMLQEIFDDGRTLGDCDDHCVLLAALFLTFGIPAEIHGAMLPNSGRFDHVIVQANIAGRETTIDPCAKNVQAPPYVQRLVPYPFE